MVGEQAASEAVSPHLHILSGILLVLFFWVLFLCYVKKYFSVRKLLGIVRQPHPIVRKAVLFSQLCVSVLMMHMCWR